MRRKGGEKTKKAEKEKKNNEYKESSGRVGNL